MSILSRLGNVIGRGSTNLSVSLKDNVKKVSKKKPSEKVLEHAKKCSTREGNRYVVADEESDRPVVYTDSLDTCIGFLVYSPQAGVAGLTHAHDGDMSAGGSLENRYAEEIVREVEIKCKMKTGRELPLEADAIVGDHPGGKLFRNTVKTLLMSNNITQENINVLYAGNRRAPSFGKHNTDYSASVAYDTRHKELYIW